MTLRHLTIISFFLLSFMSVRGQATSKYLDTIVMNFISELRGKDVDTFCIYQEYCVGCYYKWINKEDRCDFEGLYIPTYIFWLDTGQTYMTKKDNCFDYSTIKGENDSIWQF